MGRWASGLLALGLLHLLKDIIMKITIEQNGEKFTYDSGDDCSVQMSELTEKLYGLCVAAGYHPDSVGECFYDKGKDATAHLFKDDQVTS